MSNGDKEESREEGSQEKEKVNARLRGIGLALFFGQKAASAIVRGGLFARSEGRSGLKSGALRTAFDR
jgi:hypothetical protein